MCDGDREEEIQVDKNILILYFKIDFKFQEIYCFSLCTGSASCSETCQKGGSAPGYLARAPGQRERLWGDQGNDNDEDDNDHEGVM